MISGRSIGPRYSAFIGIALYSTSQCGSILLARDLVRKPVPTFRDHALRKQNRRQPLAAFDRGRVIGTPGLEKLHELFAGTVLVPFAVALDDYKQMIGGLVAFAIGVKRGGEIKARFMIERIGRDLFLQLIDGTDRLGLLGDVERCARGGDRRFVAFGFRDHLERLLCLF